MQKYIEKKIGYFSIVLISIIVFGLGLNFTRTFVFLLVPFIFLVLVRYGKWKGVFIYAITGVLLVGVLINLLGVERFVNRFQDIPGILDTRSNKPAFEGRKLLIDIVMTEFSEEPVLSKIIGHDYRWASRVIEKYYKKTYAEKIGESSTHNDFIWLLSILGWLGVMLYVIVVLAIVFNIKGRYQFFGRLFVMFFFVLTGLGGESIPIVGHRYLQAIMVAILIFEARIARLKYKRRTKLVWNSCIDDEY
jgi:O-antigen ligase